MSSGDRARAIFFGTPHFAVPCLRALLDIAEVTLVVTQPDRPAGRGMKLSAPPVKQLALDLGLPVVQPTKVRTPEFAAQIEEQRADLALVVAYGRILPASVLHAPRLGCINVHASLLPKYRGAAPIQWAIARGESETGVCLMQMDEGLDTGPVLACEHTPIGPEETAEALAERLSQLGAELVRRELPRLLRKELSPTPQDHSRASLAPVLRKGDGEVPWNRSAREVHALVRGFHPWPGAFTWLSGKRLKLLQTRIAKDSEQLAEPGTIVRVEPSGIEVACGEGSLFVARLKPEGRGEMSAVDFVSGQRLSTGVRFAKTD